MRPVSVFAKGPGSEIEQLRAELRGRWRQAARAVMVLLSLRRLAPSQIAELLGCRRPATVRRRIWERWKNYVANTAVSWPGRLRQIHAPFRARSPDQMLATAAPWTSPWLPPVTNRTIGMPPLAQGDG